MMHKILFFVLIVATAFVYCDIPVHCEYPAVHGDWVLKTTAATYNKEAPFNECKFNEPLTQPIAQVLTVTLAGPNVATNKQTGETGTWTMVDDEGLEIYIQNNKYLAYFNFTKDGTKWKSNCGLTTTGWYHANGVNVSTWGCWTAQKSDAATEADKYTVSYETAPLKAVDLDAKFTNDNQFIERVNKAAKGSWTAKAYPHLEGMALHKLLRMSGANRSPLAAVKQQYRRKHKQFLAQYATKQSLTATNLPDNFDWRNETSCGSVNCVSPVRNQASCGSCYIFSASGALESRVRIASAGKISTIFSPQDEISCSPYNQGCNGGEPLLASKYFEDFGLPSDSCYPYEGRNTQCSKKCQSDRQFVKGYQYVGGYYGACSEQGMMDAIHAHGPVTVGFMVYRDFFNYHSGIYHHVALDNENINEPDPHWEPANHGVVVIGWGTSATGEKYWIVKNSWSSSWGLNGYFWIRRGNDECDIESAATEDFPIFQ